MGLGAWVVWGCRWLGGHGCLGDPGAGDPSAQTMVAGGLVTLVTREPGREPGDEDLVIQ